MCLRWRRGPDKSNRRCLVCVGRLGRGSAFTAAFALKAPMSGSFSLWTASAVDLYEHRVLCTSKLVIAYVLSARIVDVRGRPALHEAACIQSVSSFPGKRRRVLPKRELFTLQWKKTVASPQLTVLALSVSRLGTIQKGGLPCEQNSSFQWSSVTVGCPTISVGTLLGKGLRC